MLRWNPKTRASARDLLNDPWLKVGDLDNGTHMTKEYYNEWRKATKGEDPTTSESEEEKDERGSSDSEENEEIEDENEQHQVTEVRTLTLLDTVPDVTGLNYKITFNDENPLLNETQQ